MKIINFFYNYYRLNVLVVIFLGLLSAYLDALAIKIFLNNENFFKAGSYIFLASILRLIFIKAQSVLGAKITTDLGVNIIKDFVSKSSSSSKQNELTSLVLLKAVNFNNYVIRPFLSFFINGITVLLLLFPIVQVYLFYSFYALIPLFFLCVFYFSWFKKYLTNLSNGLSVDQDLSGFFISNLQSNTLSKSNNDLISELSFSSYESLQKRTGIIYFLSQSPRSWFELFIIFTALFLYFFTTNININMAVIGGLSYTFYRVITPLNSVIQAAVSIRSFNSSSIEVMDYVIDKNFKSGYSENDIDCLDLTIDNELSELLNGNPKYKKMFNNALNLRLKNKKK